MAVPSQPQNHSCYKWDTCLGSSAPCISRIFVNNCTLFLVPLYNALSSPSFLLHFFTAGLSCLGIFGLAVLCCVHRFNETRSVEEEGCSLLQEQLCGLKSPLSLHRDRAVSSALLLSWCKMHEVFLVQREAGSALQGQLQLLGAASDEFGSWCLGQLLVLPLGWLEGADGGTGFRELWY